MKENASAWYTLPLFVCLPFPAPFILPALVIKANSVFRLRMLELTHTHASNLNLLGKLFTNFFSYTQSNQGNTAQIDPRERTTNETSSKTKTPCRSTGRVDDNALAVPSSCHNRHWFIDFVGGECGGPPLVSCELSCCGPGKISLSLQMNRRRATSAAMCSNVPCNLAQPSQRSRAYNMPRTIQPTLWWMWSQALERKFSAHSASNALSKTLRSSM